MVGIVEDQVAHVLRPRVTSVNATARNRRGTTALPRRLYLVDGILLSMEIYPWVLLEPSCGVLEPRRL